MIENRKERLNIAGVLGTRDKISTADVSASVVYCHTAKDYAGATARVCITHGWQIKLVCLVL